MKMNTQASRTCGMQQTPFYEESLYLQMSTLKTKKEKKKQKTRSQITNDVP
jgi:hypothetical protein